MPNILDSELSKDFEMVLNGCIGNKDKVRGSDYRLAIIILYKNLHHKLPENLRELLFTLIEISYHCYCPAELRSPKSILRLYNITFKHALLFISSLTKQTVIMSQKLFGIYFHALISHLPQQARIIAPSSLHTEDEERLFSSINQISLSTSSRSAASIRDNSIIRLQTEKNLNGKVIDHTTSKISKFSHDLRKILTILFKLVRTNYQDFSSELQQKP